MADALYEVKPGEEKHCGDRRVGSQGSFLEGCLWGGALPTPGSRCWSLAHKGGDGRARQQAFSIWRFLSWPKMDVRAWVPLQHGEGDGRAGAGVPGGPPPANLVLNLVQVGF